MFFARPVRFSRGRSSTVTESARDDISLENPLRMCLSNKSGPSASNLIKLSARQNSCFRHSHSASTFVSIRNYHQGPARLVLRTEVSSHLIYLNLTGIRAPIYNYTDDARRVHGNYFRAVVAVLLSRAAIDSSDLEMRVHVRVCSPSVRAESRILAMRNIPTRLGCQSHRSRDCFRGSIRTREKEREGNVSR